MSNKPTTWARKLSIWMNAVADAWNMGEADWAYPNGRSAAVKFWSRAYRMTGNEQAATDVFVAWAQEHGVNPKRHKVGAR